MYISMLYVGKHVCRHVRIFATVKPTSGSGKVQQLTIQGYIYLYYNGAICVYICMYVCMLVSPQTSS